MLHLVLFLMFAALAIAGAINLLAQSHPINSALSLIVVMTSLAVLYLLLGAEFVAAVQMIIYAGAIMVLFIFVIMLLNAGAEEKTAYSRVAVVFGYPAVVVLVGILTWLLVRQTTRAPAVRLGQFIGSTKEIGHLLFRDFLLPFEVTSVLVLIAIMGAVVLAHPLTKTAGPPRPASDARRKG